MTTAMPGKRDTCGRDQFKRLIASPISSALRAMFSPPAKPLQARRRDKIHLETLEPRVLMSGDVNPAALTLSGSIDVPGEKDYYAFSVEESTRIVFDSQTRNSELNWRLEGPAGQIINTLQA